MKNLFKIILLCAAFFVISCSHREPSARQYKKMEAQIANFKLPKTPEAGKALVYIVRTGRGEGLVYKKVRYRVFVGDKDPESSVGYTQAGQYIYFDLKPGTHKLFSKAETWNQKDVTVKAGEILYLQQDIRFGWIRPRNALIELNPTEGKFWVKKFRKRQGYMGKKM